MTYRIPVLPILVIGLSVAVALFWVWWTSTPEAETVVPQLRLEFQTEPGETEEMRAFAEAFARREGFEFYDSTDLMDPGNRNSWFFIDVVRDGIITISITHAFRRDSFFVFFYDRGSSDDFWEVVSLFIDELSSRWPNVAPYLGP